MVDSLIQDAQSPDRELKPEPPDCKRSAAAINSDDDDDDDDNHNNK